MNQPTDAADFVKAQADLERAIEILMTGRRDPEFERRIHAETEKIIQAVLEKHGVLDIGVPSIRALRDGDESDP
jgi:hypothetical protein